jgi:hypothetical protein
MEHPIGRTNHFAYPQNEFLPSDNHFTYPENEIPHPQNHFTHPKNELPPPKFILRSRRIILPSRDYWWTSLLKIQQPNPYIFVLRTI